MAQVVVELYGAPRLKAGRGTITLEASTVADALDGLARACPGLAGVVRSGSGLHPAYRLNLNGDRFVTDPTMRLAEGDALLLLAADAGG